MHCKILLTGVRVLTIGQGLQHSMAKQAQYKDTDDEALPVRLDFVIGNMCVIGTYGIWQPGRHTSTSIEHMQGLHGTLQGFADRGKSPHDWSGCSRHGRIERCAVCVCISRTSLKKLASNAWHTREKLEGTGTAELSFTVYIHKAGSTHQAVSGNGLTVWQPAELQQIVNLRAHDLLQFNWL